MHRPGSKKTEHTARTVHQIRPAVPVHSCPFSKLIDQIAKRHNSYRNYARDHAQYPHRQDNGCLRAPLFFCKMLQKSPHIFKQTAALQHTQKRKYRNQHGYRACRPRNGVYNCPGHGKSAGKRNQSLRRVNAGKQPRGNSRQNPEGQRRNKVLPQHTKDDNDHRHHQHDKTERLSLPARSLKRSIPVRGFGKQQKKHQSPRRCRQTVTRPGFYHSAQIRMLRRRGCNGGIRNRP